MVANIRDIILGSITHFISTSFILKDILGNVSIKILDIFITNFGLYHIILEIP